MFAINNEEWFIAYVPEEHPMLYRSDGSLSIGACDDTSKTIYIKENLPSGLFKKVLCHEITHAAMFAYNVELNNAEEELIADLIATYGEEIINITNTLFDRLRGR